MTENHDESVAAPSRQVSRRAVLTTLGALPVVTVAASIMGATEAAAAAANVNPSAPRQTIRGFGAMCHAAWIGDLTPASGKPRSAPATAAWDFRCCGSR
ncbi:hypothetical protein [Nucisporomicrobium flavum]|uniref:hypothetical protein n=1 Tax=Nucisporomicrobium flavum TaxID=2785915 RepID=UPI001F26D3DE|nr:hypothetical protein [Nucisporomicrobium flavum]